MSMSLPRSDINYISLGTYDRSDINRLRSLQINRDILVVGKPIRFVQEAWAFNTMRNYYPSKGNYLYYAIYEYDSYTFRTFEQHLVTTVGSQGNYKINLEIASANTPYITGTIRISPVPEPNAIIADCTNQYWAENDQIKFNVLRNY